MLLAADTVLTGAELLRPGWIDVADGMVRATGAGAPPRPAHELGAVTVVPGFVDTHVHGGAGANFTAADTAQTAVAVDLHRRHGTTTLIASLVTAAPDELLRQVGGLAADVRSGLLDGIHLEGPWLSESRCGAHEPALMRDPDPAEVDRVLAAGAGRIRMVTLAPERHGAPEAIDGSSARVSWWPSGTPRRPTPRPGARSTRARRWAPTCSMRCARSTVANPAR